MPHARRPLALLALTLVFPLSPATAQPFGTYSWQLQPFCNRVTVTLNQDGALYSLDGFDDQCGAAQRAPLVGTAVLNPDGTAGLGFTVVTVPSARAVHVDARVNPATGSGTWGDSAGNSGTFALGGRVPGSPRPLPANALAWGTIIQGPATGGAGSIGLGVLVSTPGPGMGAAIVGQWGNVPTSSPPWPSAIRGLSQGEIGVLGISTSSVGVIGVSTSGPGVGGQSTDGPGVFGGSDNGPGVRAVSFGTGPNIALELHNGGIAVAGPLRPAFQHLAAAGNSSGNLTRIDHPLLNGVATAMVFVTHVYVVPGASVYVVSPVGVYYDAALSRWTIYREDLALMPAGAMFNVLVVNQ